MKIKNLLFYCGLTKEEYENVKDRIIADNARNLTVFSALAAIAFTCGVMAQILFNLGMNAVIEALLAVAFIIIAVISGIWGKKIEYISKILVQLFSFLLLAMGVFAGVSQPNNRTTLLLAFYGFVAVLFSQRLIAVVSIIFVTEFIYLCLIINTQSGNILSANVVNTLIFSCMGCLSSVSIMKVKYRKYSTDYFNQFLIERDPLTSLYNRHSYESELEKIKKNRKKVTICAFDINGLKTTNDLLGHAAGDELIIGSARCIEEVFGPYGKIFRTGGDEFIGILDREYGSRDELLSKFIKIQENWQGELINEMNVSCGIAVLEDDFDNKLSDTIILADKLMYEQKRKYYESHVSGRHIYSD